MEPNEVEACEVRREDAVAAYGTRKGPETPRDRLWTAVIVLAVLTALSGFVSLLLFFAVAEVQTSQREGRDRGYESRAVACSNMAQSERALPAPCLAPEVLVHYDSDPE